MAEQIYEILRARIAKGLLPPGSRLVQPELAASLGVSRTPLREALRRLEQDRLIEGQPGMGLRVSRITREEAAEAIQLRAMVESFAGGLAATRASDDELSAIAAIQERAASAVAARDLQLLAELNSQFHQAIVAASRSRYCVAMAGQLQDWLLQYRPVMLSEEAARRHYYLQHDEIWKALARHDAAATEQLMREHINDSGHLILSVIDARDLSQQSLIGGLIGND